MCATVFLFAVKTLELDCRLWLGEPRKNGGHFYSTQQVSTPLPHKRSAGTIDGHPAVPSDYSLGSQLCCSLFCYKNGQKNFWLSRFFWPFVWQSLVYGHTWMKVVS